MYAVIANGGKQYRVKEGQVLKLESIVAKAGEKLELSEVLMISDGDKTTTGAPFVKGAKVTAAVVSHGRRKKIEIIKFRRRKHHMKRMGHRQNFTEVEIQKISLRKTAAKAATAKTTAKNEVEAVE